MFKKIPSNFVEMMGFGSGGVGVEAELCGAARAVRGSMF
jgi:hypothetical protein